MNFKTTLLLLVVLALVGAAIFWQREREVEDFDVDLAMFEGVDVARVETIRVDNIERSINMRLERDGRGTWFLTDPILYPADNGYVTALLEDIARGRAMVVPEEEWGEKELGFDPPRIVLEVDERRPEGLHTYAVEIGAEDLDRRRVNVRIGGRYLRALVRTYTTLDRTLDDFRSHRILPILGDDVIEVHRTGRVQLEVDGEIQDMELHAFVDGLAWRSTAPYRALLAGMDIGVLVHGAAHLEALRFVEDEVEDLAPYALDHPLMRIELMTGDGDSVTLLFSRIGNTSAWYAMREGGNHVYSIDDQDMLRVLYPTQDMVDLHFMRAQRNEVSALRLSSPERELRLERTREGWVLSVAEAGEKFGATVPADMERVEDVIARLEALEVRPGVGGAQIDAEAPALGVRIETARGEFGGRIGGDHSASNGVFGVLFQRDGDDRPTLSDPWLAKLAAIDSSIFRSTTLSTLIETELTDLHLGQGAAARHFTRDNRGLWHRAGQEAEARDLLGALDALIFLRAEAYLGAGGELQAPIEVRFERFDGGERSFVVGSTTGPDGAPASEVLIDGQRSRLRVADLHSRLAALLKD